MEARAVELAKLSSGTSTGLTLADRGAARPLEVAFMAHLDKAGTRDENLTLAGATILANLRLPDSFQSEELGPSRLEIC